MQELHGTITGAAPSRQNWWEAMMAGGAVLQLGMLAGAAWYAEKMIREVTRFHRDTRGTGGANG